MTSEKNKKEKEKICDICRSGVAGPMAVQSKKFDLFQLTYGVSYSMHPSPQTVSLCEFRLYDSISPAQITLEKSFQLSSSHHLGN